MHVRTACALTIFAIGIGAPLAPAAAQYYPPAPRGYSVPSYRPVPPIAVDDEDEALPLDPPGIYSPAPPAGADPRYSRVYPDEAEPVAPARPGFIYRERPPGYEPIDPRVRGRQDYGSVAPGVDVLRPPGGIGADQQDTPVTGALPPEDRPEVNPPKELPAQFRRALVDYRSKEPAGTLIIDTPNTYLYLVLGNGKAMRYGIGVGRDGFTWTGTERVSRMAEWPDWHPPVEMIERQPYLPRFMAGGEGNPLGARALYLGKTLYRIHGTNQPSTIGSFVSSGCIRLTNEDISDLYTRVQVGTRVVVLPGAKPPAVASAPPPSSRVEAVPLNPPAVIRGR
jgi:lipoprotein-anchoring transpeptidase ErfK/SrfK